MNDSDIQKAYEAENQRDYVAQATLGSMVSIPLQLSCLVMDYFMYGDRPGLFITFVKVRVAVAAFTLLVLVWFRKQPHLCPRRVFGVTWFTGPLLMVLWMIYYVKDPIAPYYAGLNIILLAMGLISPWTYKQNLCITMFTLVMYVVVVLSMANPEYKYLFNNTTFLFLTAAFVILGSRANSRQRLHEFTLRYELDKNRKSLEESNRRLIELDQLKSRFFANVSHELRTPLTLLLAPLESLIQKYQGVMDPSGRELLATMQAGGMRLLKLINDLLDLIRLESGRLQVKHEPVALPEFINGMASAVRQLAINKKITLEAEVDPAVGTVLGDRDKLEKILLNLLFNALKFTPAGGAVRLKVEKQNEELVFIVSDTGVGIAEKSLPFVFDRFWQEDGSSKRKFQGVGIGLALVKELTEIQNGTTAVQSREGEGAAFTIRLPYLAAPPAPVAQPAPASEPVPGDEWLANLYHRAELFPVIAARREANGAEPFIRSTQRPLVLVADDEPDMRRFLTSQLADEYETVEAIDGREAAEKAKTILPDVILLDLMMPHMDGLQVCHELRANAATAGIPIILLTARADEEAKFDALQMGANDFLAKPFSSVELQARVRNLVERHRYQHRLSRQNDALSSAIEQIKETELQLVQSEKLSSLGRLSAGIIHEINNPLNFSLTGLFALRNKGKHLAEGQRAEFEAIINDVEEGLKRVRNIVSDLRTFTHPGGGGGGELVVVADAINAALRFLAGEWKNKVTIHQDLPPGQSLWADQNKLIHVLVNLLQNAIDALLEKKFAAGEQPQIWIEGRVEQDRSLIVVRDNGPGIDAKNVDKIFDPFFTTKDVGKGMGMGLSICYRIVQGYGGKISVRSEPGQMCEFTLDLAATAAAAAKTTPEHAESL
jgi:signal transduction histidine kinase